MSLTPILVAAVILVFAADQDAPKSTGKKTVTADKKKDVGKANDADKAKAAKNAGTDGTITCSVLT